MTEDLHESINNVEDHLPDLLTQANLKMDILHKELKDKQCEIINLKTEMRDLRNRIQNIKSIVAR